MIGKTIRSTDFGGAVGYVLGKKNGSVRWQTLSDQVERYLWTIS